MVEFLNFVNSLIFQIEQIRIFDHFLEFSKLEN